MGAREQDSEWPRRSGARRQARAPRASSPNLLALPAQSPSKSGLLICLTPVCQAWLVEMGHAGLKHEVRQERRCFVMIRVEPMHPPAGALPWLCHRSSKKGQAKTGATTPGRAGSKPALKKAQKGSAAPVHVVDVVEEAVQRREQVRRPKQGASRISLCQGNTSLSEEGLQW